MLVGPVKVNLPIGIGRMPPHVLLCFQLRATCGTGRSGTHGRRQSILHMNASTLERTRLELWLGLEPARLSPIPDVLDEDPILFHGRVCYSRYLLLQSSRYHDAMMYADGMILVSPVSSFEPAWNPEDEMLVSPPIAHHAHPVLGEPRARAASTTGRRLSANAPTRQRANDSRPGGTPLRRAVPVAVLRFRPGWWWCTDKRRLGRAASQSGWRCGRSPQLGIPR